MEVLVCCVFAYWLVKHTPQLIGESVAEWQYARRGEESPAVAARRARLAAAGIDPASGGAFRQFAGNVWRDMWLGLDKKLQDRHTNATGEPEDVHSGSADRGWWGRLGDRIDARVAEKAARWQTRTADNDGLRNLPLEDHRPPATAAQPAGDPTTDADDTTEFATPDTGESGTTRPGETPDMTGSTDWDAEHDWIQGASERLRHDLNKDCLNPHCDDCAASYRDTPGSGRDRGPVRVPSTLGDPVNQPSNTGTAVLELEGTPNMTDLATRGTAVTGVVSGAAEARSIQRALAAATSAYQAAVAQARTRIHSMGEQTLSTVQMAGKSTVVQSCAAAAEAIAAAQASVNACDAEVIPLLGRVAREFDKRNS